MSLGGELAKGGGSQWVAAQQEVPIIESMVIDMNATQVKTLEQVRQVPEGTQALEFRAADEQMTRLVSP